MTAAVDVVVPTRDRPAPLAACLRSLRDQTLRDFTVTVVDDGGRTPVRPPAHLVEELDVHVVRNERSVGAGISRNRGVARGTAPCVVLLDDDCVAHPDLLARHVAALSAGPAPAVSLGPIRRPPGRRLPAWTHWDADRLEREYDRLARGEIEPTGALLYTGNVGFHRAAFHDVGGIDPRLRRQEDIELGHRLARHGCRFGFDPGATVWHDSARSLRGWLRVPGAGARFDVLMDELVPDSGRLDEVRRQMAAKHRALRVARTVLDRPVARPAAVLGAVGAGCVLHAARADAAALAAFSLVWDLQYSHALDRAVAAARDRAVLGAPDREV